MLYLETWQKLIESKLELGGNLKKIYSELLDYKVLVMKVLGNDHPAAMKVNQIKAYYYGKGGDKDLEKAYLSDFHESVRKAQGQTPEQINL